MLICCIHRLGRIHSDDPCQSWHMAHNECSLRQMDHCTVSRTCSMVLCSQSSHFQTNAACIGRFPLPLRRWGHKQYSQRRSYLQYNHCIWGRKRMQASTEVRASRKHETGFPFLIITKRYTARGKINCWPFKSRHCVVLGFGILELENDL